MADLFTLVSDTKRDRLSDDVALGGPVTELVAAGELELSQDRRSVRLDGLGSRCRGGRATSL